MIKNIEITMNINSFVHNCITCIIFQCKISYSLILYFITISVALAALHSWMNCHDF